MAEPAERMKMMRARRRREGLRELRLVVPDARSETVRNRLATQVAKLRPICGRPPPRKMFLQCFDQIACAHMSGLVARSHVSAGQDGFRDKGSKQHSGQIEGHWVYRSVPCRGSIDHTIC